MGATLPSIREALDQGAALLTAAGVDSPRLQAEWMLASSAELMGMHADQKQLVCAELSRIVFLSTGRLMLQASWKPDAPVLWLNHDIIGRLLADASGAGIV